MWQRPSWEHIIRDVRAYHAHMKYVHFNPVKHGLAGYAAGFGIRLRSPFLDKRGKRLPVCSYLGEKLQQPLQLHRTEVPHGD